MRLRKAVPIAAAALGVAAAATLAYGALIERNRFTIRRTELSVLSPESEPLRILHISDLHMLPGQHRKQRWLRSLAGLDPDFVAITGDNLGSSDAISAVRFALEPLLDFPGAFVFGSNDYYGPVFKNPLGYFRNGQPPRLGEPLPWRELRDIFHDAGWQDLTNSRTLVTAGGRQLELAGVDDPHLRLDDYSQLAGPVDPDAAVHIGLVHSPEPRVLDSFAADGFDLVLAGHTHGGQICLPGVGALVTNCGIDTERAAGTHRWSGETWVNISAGVGTSPYFPVRIACPPEVSVVTLVAGPESRQPGARLGAIAAIG